ncbi:MAG: MFS transporter [Novosphingobium sp.]|nr:MFS transporter [Novosphingobium sp.]
MSGEQLVSDTKAQARAEFRKHWTLILAASIAFSFTSVMTSASGLFIQPLGDEFGWSRALLASGTSIAAVTTFFLSPLFGLFIDRIGTRRLALPGLAMMMCTVAALSLLDGTPMQWFILWTIYAFAALATKSTVWTAAVASTFDAGRGLALGLTLSGSAIAQTITPPLTNYLIEEHGWRSAFVWLGFGWGGLAILLCVFFLFDGYDISRKSRAAAPAGAAKNAPLLDQPGLTPREALRSPELWRIAISTFVIMIITIALVVHQFPILTESGIDRQTAAIYAGFAGFCGILGKLVTGWLLDRYPARWAGGGTLALTSVTFILLLIPGRTIPMVVAAMLVNGYAAGTKLQIAGYLTSAYGGMRNFGLIFGTMASLIAAGSGLGPVIAGWIYDVYGGYGPYLWMGLIGTLVSSVLIFGLGDYPDWNKREDPALAPS